jgi:hypothetical protein
MYKFENQIIFVSAKPRIDKKDAKSKACEKINLI